MGEVRSIELKIGSAMSWLANLSKVEAKEIFEHKQIKMYSGDGFDKTCYYCMNVGLK